MNRPDTTAIEARVRELEKLVDDAMREGLAECERLRCGAIRCHFCFEPMHVFPWGDGVNAYCSGGCGT